LSYLFPPERGDSLRVFTMAARHTGRLVILSGPSCVGKSPLYKAVGKFYPELHAHLHKLVLVNCRSPRPGEIDGVDYHFRTRAQVEALRSESRYAVLEARGDLQAIDVQELDSLLQHGDVFFEGNPYVARALQTHPGLEGVKRLSIFVSPLAQEEIIYLNVPERNISLPDLLTDVMRRKLLRRLRRQKQELSAKDLEEIEIRSSSAYRELQEAWHFEYVIPNHDGEDSDNWEAFYYPIGDARKTLEAFAALLRGSVPRNVEKWDEQLLPSIARSG
jgi:guanylate kinase